MTNDVQRILFTTTDPRHASPFGDGAQLPALTTLLYLVCGNDPVKFEEATRLVELFIAKALESRPVDLGHCREGDECVCGGDTKGVRESCGNWVKPHQV